MRSSRGRGYSLRLALNCAAIAAIALGAFATPATSAQHRYSLQIHNSSKYTISQLYVQNAELGNWGPDELREFVLSPGKTFTLRDIKPGEYNIKFVDAKGRHCTLRNLPIVKSHAWTLTSAWLEKC